jgi:hypothetical protein
MPIRENATSLDLERERVSELLAECDSLAASIEAM